MTLYEKRGRRYYPVAETRQFDSWPAGFHLVHCIPGETVTHYNIEPDEAALLAAAVPMREALMQALREASKGRPRPWKSVGLTKREQKAWAAYEAIAGGRPEQYTVPSLYDIADAAIRAVVEAAKK